MRNENKIIPNIKFNNYNCLENKNILNIPPLLQKNNYKNINFFYIVLFIIIISIIIYLIFYINNIK